MPDAPWWHGPLVGLDLETTGSDPEEARIVTAAVVHIATHDGHRIVTPSTWLADPGVDIPAEATEVHGITTERARSDGEPAADVVREVLDMLVASGAAVHPLVIFNARYDLTVLDRERARHGLDYPPLTEWGRLRVIDPLVLDKHLDRYRRGSRKLDAMAEHYGARIDGPHDAAHDALCACRIAWAIGARGQVKRRIRNADDGRAVATLNRQWDNVRSDLSALHEAQVGWAREQAEGLAQHFRENPEKGVDPESVRTEWPCVPAVTS